MIACEWLSHKNGRGKLLNLAHFLLRRFRKVQFYESCYHTTPALQKSCKRTESNQRPVALTHHETKSKDTVNNQSIQMQSDFRVLDSKLRIFCNLSR